jgi:hypothetical protein
VVEGFVSGEVYLTAVRTFPQEEGTVLYFGFEFGIVCYVDAFVDCYCVLLPAFAAGGDGLVDD